LPGHGPDLPDVSEVARKYIDRRHYRLDQIRQLGAEHGKDIELKVMIDEMYDDVDPVLRHAAEQSTRAALKYLDAHPEEVYPPSKAKDPVNESLGLLLWVLWRWSV